MKLSVVKDLLPIYNDRITLRCLSDKHINWYAEQLMQPYFNEYTDIDYRTTSTLTVLRHVLNKLVKYYEEGNNVEFIYDLRLVITNKDDDIYYGGITLFKPDTNNIVELGYWVNPLYGNNGIATLVINMIKSSLRNTEINGFKLRIQPNNKRSIRVALKCNFIQTGLVGKNLLFISQDGDKS